MYASHNSLTFAKPLRWWQWLFNPFSKCQRVDIVSQIAEGVRFFDLRVRFDGNGKLVACHGLVEYDINVMEKIAILEDSKCYYRVVLEDKVGGKHCTADDLNELEYMFCSADYPHCVYVMSKKQGYKRSNDHCELNGWLEYTRHHWTYGKPFIPRWHVGKYMANKFADSLNLETEKLRIYNYDFVDIK